MRDDDGKSQCKGHSDKAEKSTGKRFGLEDLGGGRAKEEAEINWQKQHLRQEEQGIAASNPVCFRPAMCVKATT